MVAGIMIWLVAIALLVAGGAIVFVTLLAEASRPVLGRMGSDSKAMLLGGFVLAAMGGVFIILLIFGA